MSYINIFFIYSIIGYIYEIIIALITNNKLDSGFLYGPLTPIYGIGVLLIMFVYKCIFKYSKYNKIINNILSFFITIILLTLIEFLAGNALELIFNKVYWNYSTLKFNVGKYISLEISLIWGVMSLLVIYVINPLVNKIIRKIPNGISYICIFLFIIDLVFTIIKKAF